MRLMPITLGFGAGLAVVLVWSTTSDGKIRRCEHGRRAGLRASDRLTH